MNFYRLYFGEYDSSGEIYFYHDDVRNFNEDCRNLIKSHLEEVCYGSSDDADGNLIGILIKYLPSLGYKKISICMNEENHFYIPDFYSDEQCIRRFVKNL